VQGVTRGCRLYRLTNYVHICAGSHWLCLGSMQLFFHGAPTNLADLTTSFTYDPVFHSTSCAFTFHKVENIILVLDNECPVSVVGFWSQCCSWLLVADCRVSVVGCRLSDVSYWLSVVVIVHCCWWLTVVCRLSGCRLLVVGCCCRSLLLVADCRLSVVGS